MARKTVAFSRSGIGTLPNDKPVLYGIQTESGKTKYVGIAKRGRVQERLAEHLPEAKDFVPGTKVQIEQQPMNDLINKRLKTAREKAGLTQAQLAEKLGFKDRQTLAAIEAGQRKMSATELVRAMDVFGVDLDYFTDGFRLVGEGRFSWRADRNATEALLDAFEERAGRWIATYRRLGEYQGAKTDVLQVHLPLNERSSFEDAVAAGEALGAEWKLGDQPAITLDHAIQENLRALVLYVEAPKGISGAACQVPGVNAIFINRREPEGRRNFDLAHEVFHLLTWEQMPPEHKEPIEVNHRGKGRHKRVEQLAENFAAALLMPERELEPLWRARSDENINAWLNRTAPAFLVSAKALKWRLTNLGWLSKADHMDIREAKLTANGRPPREQQNPRLFCEGFVRRMHTGLAKGQLSVRRAASLLEITIEELAQLFRDYQLPVPFDL
jgi:Zn-dependent peptidase ImmA (M78 family)/DNA-binding XRE family transcriptional regulator